MTEKANTPDQLRSGVFAEQKRSYSKQNRGAALKESASAPNEGARRARFVKRKEEWHWNGEGTRPNIFGQKAHGFSETFQKTTSHKILQLAKNGKEKFLQKLHSMFCTIAETKFSLFFKANYGKRRGKWKKTLTFPAGFDRMKQMKLLCNT